MSEFDELRDRARTLADRAGTGRVRTLLGITGAPGAGKSTLAARLADALGPATCRLVGLDGFHIGDAELRRSGLRDRKGAPETFDRAGYGVLLRRLREDSGTVYAPEFDRGIEDSIAAAVAVPADVPLVITEGNYLLVWPEVAALLDEVWFIDPEPRARLAALVRRHTEFGKSAEDARAWATGPDAANAELVARGRDQADLVLGWTSP